MCTGDAVNATKARLAMKSYRMNLQVSSDVLKTGRSMQAESQDLWSVLILDRMPFTVKLQSVLPAQTQIFVIINDWSDLKDYEKLSDERVCRFYLWPLNWELIIDDIRAISLAERFLTRGKIEAGGLLIDTNAHTVSYGIETVLLRKKEYELLSCLMKNRGRVLSRSALLEMVWDFNSQITTNTVDVHISRLRKILKTNFGLNAVIKTIPCAGYLFT